MLSLYQNNGTEGFPPAGVTSLTTVCSSCKEVCTHKDRVALANRSVCFHIKKFRHNYITFSFCSQTSGLTVVVSRIEFASLLCVSTGHIPPACRQEGTASVPLAMALSLSRAQGLAGAGEAVRFCAGAVQSSAGLDQREVCRALQQLCTSVGAPAAQRAQGGLAQPKFCRCLC